MSEEEEEDRYPNPGFSPWHAHYKVEKYNDSKLGREPDEVIEWDGNLMMNAGTAYTTGANAYVAAGSGVAAADHSDTTLTTEWGTGRKQATAVVTNQSVAFSANYAAGQATGVWEEVGVLNGPGADDLLNHVVASLGNKAGAAAWVLTITITIS